MQLRPYQSDCVSSIFREFEERTSTLAVMATGTGKSRVFSEVAKRMIPKRSIIIAHRKELILQAAATLNRIGIPTEIEMAGYKANHSMFGRETAVVASVQTLISGIEQKRMEKFNPEDFGLLIVDECHHGVSDSYKVVIDHFRKNPFLKVLGVTATPDRADEEALGQIMESVAFEYEIDDAINDGWLCDIEQQIVHINGLDYSSCRTAAGDLNGADLSAIMEDESNLQGITGATLALIGTTKKTLVFTASVRHAEQCNNIFNRAHPGLSIWVNGKMPDDERDQNIRDFRSGKVRVLTNCGVATEGFDVPDTEVIVMARPTKSRALFSQMVGRGTRPLPHTVDGLDSADARKAAISASAKPRCIILDFAGNSGRHKLISCSDILGGKYSEEAVELAERTVAKGGGKTVTQALKDAEKELRERVERAKRDEEARKARLVAKVQFTVQRVNPFDAFDLVPAKERGWDQGKRLSDKQRGVLLKLGVNPDQTPYAQGRQLVAEACRRWRDHLCTAKQATLLKKHGFTETQNMTMKEASRIIDELAQNGWKRKVVAA